MKKVATEFDIQGLEIDYALVGWDAGYRYDCAMQNGLNLWDTAYVYGMGTSEKTLGEFLRTVKRDSFYISAKFTPQCADEFAENAVTDMFKKSADLLGVDFMNFYWIHNPVDAQKMGKRINTTCER